MELKGQKGGGSVACKASMDWFKGTQGTHICWDKTWFPVDFPWNDLLNWMNKIIIVMIIVTISITIIIMIIIITIIIIIINHCIY